MLEKLEAYLQKLVADGAVLAYSGGVDSTLLLAVLGQIKQKQAGKAVALTMQTPLQDERDTDDAAMFAGQAGMEQIVLTFNPLALKEVCHNRKDRCYYCKKAIFVRFREYAEANGLKYLLDGTNADDLQAYRPGIKALRELGVVSPLAELGIGKAEVRQMSAALGLPTADKPAMPCLATRFEYNTLIDTAAVRRVAQGERTLRGMFPKVRDMRLRVHGNLARLEVPPENIVQAAARAQEIAAALEACGFDYVTLDLQGFCSGSFDKR